MLSGNGKGFTAGLDLSELSTIRPAEIEDIGRRGFYIRKFLENWQNSISSTENVILFKCIPFFDLILKI